LGPQVRQELPVRKDPLGWQDHKDLLEHKVLWELQELPVRKAPQGRQAQ
jgi:hypothetical protein